MKLLSSYYIFFAFSIPFQTHRAHQTEKITDPVELEASKETTATKIKNLIKNYKKIFMALLVVVVAIAIYISIQIMRSQPNLGTYYEK